MAEVEKGWPTAEFRSRAVLAAFSLTAYHDISYDALRLEYEQKSSIVPFLVHQRTLFISSRVGLSREDSNSQDLKLLTKFTESPHSYLV